VIPKQTHSAITIAAERIVGDSCEALEGDALIIHRDLTTKKQLYGIRTADCVPILVVTKKECALIHAGWRGLAQQIIKGALQQLDRDSLYCAIGPCASALRYEVGREVIAQIGDSAHYTERDGRIFLDLVATTKEQLYRCAPNAQVTSSDICTIEDLRFHSHRRDGGDAGRNLMYYCTGV
jgi:hypothetical protein